MSKNIARSRSSNGGITKLIFSEPVKDKSERVRERKERYLNKKGSSCGVVNGYRKRRSGLSRRYRSRLENTLGSSLEILTLEPPSVAVCVGKDSRAFRRELRRSINSGLVKLKGDASRSVE